MDTSKLEIDIGIYVDGLHLIAVHGACCLALRHPAFTGPLRKLVLEFIEAAEWKLKQIGAINEEDIKEIHQVEQEESPHRDIK